MNATVTPTHHRTEFVQDIETGWYIRQPQRIAFGKIPERLKVERTLETRIQANGAREVITGPFREKRRTFFSGLIPLHVPGWFIGNDYEQRGGQKRNSLVLFRFSDTDRLLTVFYFTGWYIDNREKRAQYANEFARMNSVTRSN
jgi:hypothetical protein